MSRLVDFNSNALELTLVGHLELSTQIYGEGNSNEFLTINEANLSCSIYNDLETYTGAAGGELTIHVLRLLEDLTRRVQQLEAFEERSVCFRPYESQLPTL